MMKHSPIDNSTTGHNNSLLSMPQLYPWLVWFLASSFIFYKYLLQVSPSIMVDDLMSDFALSGEALGQLAAYYFYAYFVMQLPAGLILDRVSPRKVFAIAIIICSAGAAVFSHATSLAMAKLGRLLIGLGGAFSAVGTMKFISLWFTPKRFALVSGMMMTMAMLGAICGEAPLAYLTRHVGWRSTLELCAAFGVLLALLAYLFIRDKKPLSGSINTAPQNLIAGLFQLLKGKESWLISIYSGLAFAPISAFAGLWGIPFIQQHYTTSKPHAAAIVSIAFIGFAIGSPFAGWLSDKINRRKPIMAVGTLLSLISLSLIIYCPPLPGALLKVLFLLFGISSGFFFVSFAYIREINRYDLSGTSIGFINMFDALFGAIAEPFIGKLLDMGWDHQIHAGARVFSTANYQHALAILPAALIVACICLLFVKETYCQNLLDFNSAE